MRTWGRKSLWVYNQLDPTLQVIFTRLRDEVADISLVSGYRDRVEQGILVEIGASKLPWPKSKHNSKPAVACDFRPYPYPEYEPKIWGALGYIAGRAMAIGKEEGVILVWGGDWDGDGDTTDQDFDDLFHLEIDKWVE